MTIKTFNGKVFAFELHWHIRIRCMGVCVCVSVWVWVHVKVCLCSWSWVQWPITALIFCSKFHENIGECFLSWSILHPGLHPQPLLLAWCWWWTSTSAKMEMLRVFTLLILSMHFFFIAILFSKNSDIDNRVVWASVWQSPTKQDFARFVATILFPCFGKHKTRPGVGLTVKVAG